jgi:putative sterol carrier protein
VEFLDEIVAKLSAAIIARPAPKKSLKIKLKGLGVVVATDSSITKNDCETDTTITISRGDLEKLAAGKLNPELAYMQGKIKISGDPLVALQWLPVLRGK